MASHDDTLLSFPSYAELSQTAGWAGGGTPLGLSAVDAAIASGGRYRETELLGSGGMGKVLLARDGRIGRDVAVKVLHAEYELAPDERERFLREAQIQGQLEHPSIVPVYDIDQRADGSTFFTMRRVLGRTLAAILDDLRERKCKTTQRELLQAFTTICLTIDYAHSRGVVHRDIKPANIMLGDFGEVYVLDWGIARVLSGSETAVASPASRLSMPGTMMGTPLYMAPEQMADPEVGPSADIFALGAVLFEILTLERLRDPRAVFAPPESRPSIRVPGFNVAPELESICVIATQMLSEDRYPSARALQEAVAAYLEGDRELAQRRAIAAKHAAAARASLVRAGSPSSDHEAERGHAMRDLVRALALEPTNDEHVAMLAEMMKEPPRTIPTAVAHQTKKQQQDIARSGMRYTAAAMLSWFLFMPVIFIAGMREATYVFLIAAAAGATALIAFIASRRRTVGKPVQYVMIGTMMVAGVALSRIFGPFILMPTMLATWAIVTQAHPDRGVRRYGLALAIVAMVLPIGLELAGVIPTSYMFEGGIIKVLPQMTELSANVTIPFLTIAHVAIAVMPAAFVGSLRTQLADAQQHQLLQTWHFRRLGADLVRASTGSIKAI